MQPRRWTPALDASADTRAQANPPDDQSIRLQSSARYGHRRLTQAQIRVLRPTRRTINRSGYKAAPGQPASHVRTDLPAPSTGRHDAARSIDTGARRMCRCACSCQPTGRQIDPATQPRPVNRADICAPTSQPRRRSAAMQPGRLTLVWAWLRYSSRTS